MKKIFEFNQGYTNNNDLGDSIWEWLKENGYIDEGEFGLLKQDIQLIIEIIEK